MSIKADRWITTRSTPPSHILHTVHGRETQFAWDGVTHTKEQLRTMQDRYMATRVRPEELQEEGWAPMIEPFERRQVREENGERVISYGNSSYGYDVRLSEEFKLFTNINSAVIDPKRFDEKCLIDAELKVDPNGDKYVILPPNSYLLGRTVEYFRIPRNVTVVAVGKSTYARAGAIVNVTPIEAEFEGNVVIEISNSTNLPLKIYANEGISQFLFFESNEDCETSYADRDGKYQGQRGLVTPRV